MADHHVDSMHIDYSAAAKHILQRHGLYINDAPPINHKPGNDFISDWFWPLPHYPDDRFVDYYENAKDTTDDSSADDDSCKCDPCCCDGNCSCCAHKCDKFKFPENFEILSDEIKKFKGLTNPIISYVGQDGDTFIDQAAMPYTGLVLQALEKRAFDITYIKPFLDEDGKLRQQMIIKEIVCGHSMSIATFDGWKYHIYRGICRYITKVDPPKSVNGKPLRPRTVPFGANMIEAPINLKQKPEDVVRKNVHIVLDCSASYEGNVVSIPINQIIDVQDINYIYDFTIYEGNLKVFWDDWSSVKDYTDDTYFSYIPGDYIPPQTLYHEVIEHQKPIQREFMKVIRENTLAVQYNEFTEKALVYRLARYKASVTFKDNCIVVYNEDDINFIVKPYNWIVFDLKENRVLTVIDKNEFYSKYMRV